MIKEYIWNMAEKMYIVKKRKEIKIINMYIHIQYLIKIILIEFNNKNYFINILNFIKCKKC